MEQKTKKQDIRKNMDWNQFFTAVTTPFNGNCLILLNVKDNKISIEAVASTLDSLGFALGEKNRPDYFG